MNPLSDETLQFVNGLKGYKKIEVQYQETQKSTVSSATVDIPVAPVTTMDKAIIVCSNCKKPVAIGIYTNKPENTAEVGCIDCKRTILIEKVKLSSTEKFIQRPIKPDQQTVFDQYVESLKSQKHIIIEK